MNSTYWVVEHPEEDGRQNDFDEDFDGDAVLGFHPGKGPGSARAAAPEFGEGRSQGLVVQARGFFPRFHSEELERLINVSVGCRLVPPHFAPGV